MMQKVTNWATVCFLVSSPMTLKTLEPHIRLLSQSQAVVVVANFNFRAPFIRDAGPVSAVHLPLIRGLAPLADLVTVMDLLSLLSKIKPKVLVTLTPKAGLLGQIVGWMTRIPIRIHWFTGQVWSSKAGLPRFLLKLADRLVAALCTFGWVDGPSQLSFLEEQKIVTRGKFSVLGRGSVAGVDTDRFCPSAKMRDEVRRELEIAPDEVVISYLGRLTVDKGIADLAHALAELRTESKICLVAIGPDEEGIQGQLEWILRGGGVSHRFVGFEPHPERYLQASDIFCLPSYREGFPTSVLEASAVGLPIVVSRIYGTAGTFVEGITGISFSAGNREELADVLRRLIDSREKSKKMGLAARDFIMSQFKQVDLVNAFAEEIQSRVRADPILREHFA